MRSLNSEIDTSVAKGNELLQRGKTSILHRNGRSKKSERDLRFQSSQLHLQHHQPVTNEILNPFVHRLELSTNYEKLKVSRKLFQQLLPEKVAEAFWKHNLSNS